MTPARLALGLGSSDRDALGWLRRAVAALKAEPGLRMLAISPIYESDALLPPDAPASWNVPYLNLAVSLEVDAQELSPLALLDRIKKIEKRLGRQERERWAPREIDIDILAWTGVRLQTEQLSIPHPGLIDRPFALLPLAEVAAGELVPMPGDLPGAQGRSAHVAGARGATVPFRTRRTLSSLTELVAIFNLTPDSFSDGGKLATRRRLCTRPAPPSKPARACLDLGAESTRPGAALVSPTKNGAGSSPRSVARTATCAHARDSGSASTRATPRRWSARSSTAPFDWLNDVTGFENPRSRELARDSKTDLVVMHSLGVPPTRHRT